MTVVVVGSINVDLIATGARFPAPGETVTMTSFAEQQGGKGANQAAVAASLGADVRIVAAVGDDARGTSAQEDLRARGVELVGVVTVPEPTGVALILVDGTGENTIAVVPGANASLSARAVSARLEAIEDSAVVVLASLEIPVAAVLAAAAVARARRWRFVLNPAPARDLPDELIRACDLITPNATEAESFGGASALLARGARAVIVTRGSEGAILYRPDLPSEAISAEPAEVVDTIGAGDAYSAALAVALDDGLSLIEAARWAAAAAAIATESSGARGYLPRREAVVDRLS